MDSYQLDQQTMDEMTEVLLRLYFAIQMCTIMQRKVQNFASWVLVFRQRMRDTITVTCKV
jgi:hypothetical protein